MPLTPEERAMKAREARRVHNKIEHRKTVIKKAEVDLPRLVAQYEQLMNELLDDGEEDG